MKTSMRHALFRCCVTALHLPEYEQATDAVLAGLELNTVPVKEFGCCGYPLRNVDQMAWLLASGRNLALAEAYDSSIVTVCNCCYGTLKHCAWILSRDETLRDHVNDSLRKEGLRYVGTAKVRHFFEVLNEDVGGERLKEKMRQSADGLGVAIHYGCRILRPSGILGMDNPFHPTLLDTFVEAVGARSVNWKRKTDCCGAPVMTTDKELSATMAESKVAAARKADAEAICVACPFCQLRLAKMEQEGPALPVISFPLLLAMGMEKNEGRFSDLARRS